MGMSSEFLHVANGLSISRKQDETNDFAVTF